MSARRTPEELSDMANRYYEQYLSCLRQLHEGALTSVTHGTNTASSVQMERKGSREAAPSPILKSIAFANEPMSRTPTFGSAFVPSHTGGSRGRRYTNDFKPPLPLSADRNDSDPEDGFLALTAAPNPQQPHGSLANSDSGSYVQGSILRETFSEADLVNHLLSIDPDKQATVTALNDVWTKRHDINNLNIFAECDDRQDGMYENATYEIYNIESDAMAVAQHESNGDEDGEVLKGLTVWQRLKDVNSAGTAAGRITILQEPSPVMLAAAHLTMSRHFDMNELYLHLIHGDGNKSKTKAFMNRASEATELRQRSFFFVFKYYTVVGETSFPAPFQQYDNRPPERRDVDHIDIAECSSVLALSLGGSFLKETPIRGRRRRAVGKIFDTFAPWHLLHIQCFPDDEHSMRSEDLAKPFYNGPYAFLDTLAAEYRDAVKRLALLHEKITKLITPPNEFMFNVRLRDKLLFEDQYFTYSRRYFWAYNTLGVINDGIKAMRSAYHNTFTEDFWAGRHQTLWPHPDPTSEHGRQYLNLMATLRSELNRVVADLDVIYDKNKQTQKEIQSLRDQLFSGSSVKESRRAIEQGDNIKILTGISMIFLPLTFVTSVFGITNFNISADDWRFPVTMVGVCIPFFILIFVLQTRMGMEALKNFGRSMANAYMYILGRGGGSGNDHGGHVLPHADGRRKKRFRSGRKTALRRSQSGIGSLPTDATWHFGFGKRRSGSFWPWRLRESAGGSEDVEKGRMAEV